MHRNYIVYQKYVEVLYDTVNFRLTGYMQAFSVTILYTFVLGDPVQQDLFWLTDLLPHQQGTLCENVSP